MKNKKTYKIIISGGGTGGHIFPAIAIARTLQQKLDNVEILFVGALGRMEMEKVPAAGFKIIGLPMYGFNRKNIFKNIKVVWQLFKSMNMVKKIIRDFNPDAVVGVGGYASAPTLRVAANRGIPVLLQEQNSYAGMTNKWLAKKANTICVAYPDMHQFFPKEKLVLTGNPIRPELLNQHLSREQAIQTFGLSPDKKILLIIGGSLGARTINESIKNGLHELIQANVQLIWQTGKHFIEEARKATADLPEGFAVVTDFVHDMATAYQTADVVISRAGASSISELALLQKACILVPSPNVSEDHQTKNAMVLVNKHAALLVKDSQAREQLVSQAIELLNDDQKCAQLSQNIESLARPHAAQDIVQEILHFFPETIEKPVDKLNIKEVKRVFFIGIGGIGMSALARYFKLSGKEVAGYDATATALTRSLQDEGISVYHDDDITLLPTAIKTYNEENLIIYTPAIPSENHTLQYLAAHYPKRYKRAEVLGAITREKKGLCVAGTHAKTTSSGMLAYIFSQSPQPCDAFLGGIINNFNSNLCFAPQSEYCIIEADEFDRSFHHLSPHAALLTSTDADHLDIYGSVEQSQEAFADFVAKIQPHGTLVMHRSITIDIRLDEQQKVYTYSLDEPCDFYASNIQIKAGRYHFDLHTPEQVFTGLELNMPGRINVENAVGASALALLHGVHIDTIKKALATFAGVRRRFEYRLQSDRLTVIDDYAHHPTEIKSVYHSVKELYPNKKISVVFQPHLYSRTKDFATDFGKVLAPFDSIYLLDIYPAREKPMPGVSSQWLASFIDKKETVQLCTKEDLAEKLSAEQHELLLFLGAGDLHLEIDRCIKQLDQKQQRDE